MPNPVAPSNLESAVARARRLLALLRELSEAGMNLVRGLSRELKDGASAVDIEIRYCRLAKAIRQLVALEARLGQALDDVAAGRWEAEEAERSLRALTAQARKDAAFETLEQAVREAGDGEAFEKLTERLDDWYSERSVEREFTDKPVAEIILGACKALGITPDPALLTDEAMSQTLADAVRAYAAAFKATPQAAAFFAGAPDAWSPPAARRPNAIAEARPPPPG
jgi:regulator of protease activity HflC (stomatin/prohibitin superfamily)